MDPYGIHFQHEKKEANALDKVTAQSLLKKFVNLIVKLNFLHVCPLLLQLKRLWGKIKQKADEREAKLPSFDDMPSCCKSNCCNGGIQTCYLRDLRRKFLDCHTQVERKRFLLNMRDPESRSGFALVTGFFIQICCLQKSPDFDYS
jgi:hypothetical protein